MRFVYLYLSSTIFFLIACTDGKRSEMINTDVPTMMRNDSGYLVYLETPAGATYETKLDLLAAQMDTSASEPVLLPFPANKGFIHKDGEKQMVWILSKRLGVGSIHQVNVVGLIEYQEGGQEYLEIVAIPNDTDLQTISPQNFRELITIYEPAKFMFEYWLKNRYGLGTINNLRWSDELEAVEYLEQ